MYQAVIVMLAVGLLWIPIPVVVRYFQVWRLSARCKAKRAIVLSFDDGPDADVTPDLLDLLKQENEQASFFLIGKKVPNNKELVDRLLAEGHEVGSHTQQHLNAWKSLPWHSGKDIEAGVATIQTVGGSENLFRPPFGKVTALSLLQNVFASRLMAWWTIDSGDSYVPRAIEDVLDEIQRKGGGVVLMHDIDIHCRPDDGWRTNRAYILALTESIVEFSRKHEYRICRLGDL